MLLLAFTGIPHLATNGKTTLQNLVHETLGLLVSLQGRPEDPLQCLIIILLSTHPLEVHDAKLELGLVQAINGCTFAPLIGKVSIFVFSVTLLVESAEVHLCRCITEISMVMQTIQTQLQALGEEVDQVVGLELGADDYVTKPFRPEELLARMRRIVTETERLRMAR